MEILEFIFQNFWTFFGCLLLLWVFFDGIVKVIVAIKSFKTIKIQLSEEQIKELEKAIIEDDTFNPYIYGGVNESEIKNT